jgi:hypothetical protein
LCFIALSALLTKPAHSANAEFGETQGAPLLLQDQTYAASKGLSSKFESVEKWLERIETKLDAGREENAVQRLRAVEKPASSMLSPIIGLQQSSSPPSQELPPPPQIRFLANICCGLLSLSDFSYFCIANRKYEQCAQFLVHRHPEL